MKKVIVTLDDDKQISLGTHEVDNAELVYLLMNGLIAVSKAVGLEYDDVEETIKDMWEDIKTVDNLK